VSTLPAAEFGGTDRFRVIRRIEALLFGGVEPSGIVSAGARWRP